MAARDAIAAWARGSYGWLGRSPDYKAAFLATLGANAEFYAPYQDNARRWYRFAQERVPFVNHAIIHPPVDRHAAPGAPGGGEDVFVHVTKETDAGIYGGHRIRRTARAVRDQLQRQPRGDSPLRAHESRATIRNNLVALTVRAVSRSAAG